MMESTIPVSLVVGDISSARNPVLEREPKFYNVLNIAVTVNLETPSPDS